MLGIDADECADQTRGKHIDAFAVQPAFQLGQSWIAHLQRDDAAFGFGNSRRHRAAVRIGDDYRGFVERDFRRELLDLVPIQRDEKIVTIRLGFDRLGRHLHQRSGFAAAHLSAKQLRHHAVVAGLGGRTQEDGTGGHRAGAAASGEHNCYRLAGHGLCLG